MNGYQRITVSAPLRPYVREAWIQHDAITADAAPPYSVFPTPFPVLGFQYRGSLSVLRNGDLETLGQSGITGLQERVREFVAGPDTRTLLVTLEPHAGFTLFGQAMNELANEHPPLASLAPSRLVRDVEERLAEGRSAEDRVVAAEQFLSDLARRSRHQPHPRVVQAVDHLLATGGREPVESLAAKVSLSRRQLERLFLLQVGVSPKEFSSIVQFDRALRGMSASPSLAAHALRAGYADQAHFVRSFTRRAGISPGRFLRGGHAS